jgi:hypothetical protein
MSAKTRESTSESPLPAVKKKVWKRKMTRI